MRSLCSLLLPVFALSGSPALAFDGPMGALAAEEMRVLAQEFPGRMAGSPREGQAAEYLAGRLAEFGYTPAVQEFSATYRVRAAGPDGMVEREVTSRNVVVEIPGRSDRVIVVGAHYDTAVPGTEPDANPEIGGPDLQGVDDNASGAGVVLELAARFAGATPEHTLRFVLFGAEEVGLRGAREYVARLGEHERGRVELMINVDSVITGDFLYVHAGPANVASADRRAAAARDEARRIAEGLGLELRLNPGLNPKYPAGTGCCSDQVAFDEAGIPAINFEATNWNLGELDGYQQTATSEAFPIGETWHDSRLDRLAHLEANLPAGRLERRPAEMVAILLPLIEHLAGVDATFPQD